MWVPLSLFALVKKARRALYYQAVFLDFLTTPKSLLAFKLFTLKGLQSYKCTDFFAICKQNVVTLQYPDKENKKNEKTMPQCATNATLLSLATSDYVLG